MTAARLLDPAASSWVPGAGPDHPFGLHNCPYGAGRVGGDDLPRLLVRIGEFALDLAVACRRLRPDLAPLVQGPVLNPLLEAGRPAWDELRRAVRSWLGDPAVEPVLAPMLRPLDGVGLTLPFAVADFVDFYASEQHAANLGRLFRPGSAPLTENWKHLPVGYHGRAGTVVVSGTPVTRPAGQRRGAAGPVFGVSERLDVEAEVGFVLGGPTAPGRPVSRAGVREHLFGVCLVNDWSARDLQSWEYVPLGPFLGKSFATSVSPWVVPFAAFDGARVAPPVRDVALLPYLDDADDEPGGLDVRLRIELNGRTVSQPPFATTYWTPAQLVAHLTVNGAAVRAGDLLASGTVSGAGPGEQGSLIELTANGAEPLDLPDGSVRGFLQDGDEVVISACVPATATRPELSLSEVRGRVVPNGLGTV